MPRIRFTHSAETDLLELWLTIAEENLVAADESLDSIHATVSVLGRGCFITLPRPLITLTGAIFTGMRI